MAKDRVYGKRDTVVRFWLDGEHFYSKVPRLAAEGTERAQAFHHDAEDYRALCYLANIATHHRHNPRGKGVEVTADELGVEIVPSTKVRIATNGEDPDLPEEISFQQDSLF